MPQRRDDRQAESKRILRRLADEEEAGRNSFVARTARGAFDRVSAKNADRTDPLDYWGTRIGRTLGFVLAVGLVVWLVVYLTRGM
ncbi:MAG: hypothetical protein WBA36_02835 [Mesorhizobium sp.]